MVVKAVRKIPWFTYFPDNYRWSFITSMGLMRVAGGGPIRRRFSRSAGISIKTSAATRTGSRNGSAWATASAQWAWRRSGAGRT